MVKSANFHLTLSSFHARATRVKGIDWTKFGEDYDLLFFQKTNFCVLVNHVPKIYGASATVNPQKTGAQGGNTSTFIKFPDDLFVLL